MKEIESIPKHELYQRRLWFAFAACGFSALLGLATFIVPEDSEVLVRTISGTALLIGFVAFAFYIYYFRKRLSVPKEDEHKRTAQPWNSDGE